MIKGVQFQNNEVDITYKFSDNDMIVLKHLMAHGYMEFRGDADSAITNNLYDYGFVEMDDDAWHSTFVLTKLGERVVEVLQE